MIVQRAVMGSATKVAEMDLPISPTKLEAFDRGEFGLALIQDIFPELDAGQREFLITGLTPEAWKKIFG